MSQKVIFQVGDDVVYPTHGVGKIVDLESQEIAGYKLEVFVIEFLNDKMTLRVPVNKAAASGLRLVSSQAAIHQAMRALKTKARINKRMWSRRAQEYESKINSGDPVSIAEVVRDLHRKTDPSEQSYSERQMYQAALDRLARELAVIEKINTMEAAQKIETYLNEVKAA